MLHTELSGAPKLASDQRSQLDRDSGHEGSRREGSRVGSKYLPVLLLFKPKGHLSFGVFQGEKDIYASGVRD